MRERGQFLGQICTRRHLPCGWMSKVSALGVPGVPSILLSSRGTRKRNYLGRICLPLPPEITIPCLHVDKTRQDPNPDSQHK